MIRRLLPVLLLPVAVLPAAAFERTLTIDTDTTTIAFHLKATGHDVEGDFLLVGGEVRFDLETGAASGEIRVDATHAVTGDKKRDKTMHKKVLESETYPLFVFHPESIEGNLIEDGTSDLTLIGTMSIHGSDHPMRMPAEVGLHNGHVTAVSRFSIPFVEWGMKDPSWLMLRVAKEVEVTVSARGDLSQPPAVSTAGPGH